MNQFSFSFQIDQVRNCSGILHYIFMLNAQSTVFINFILSNCAQR